LGFIISWLADWLAFAMSLLGLWSIVAVGWLLVGSLGWLVALMYKLPPIFPLAFSVLFLFAFLTDGLHSHQFFSKFADDSSHISGFLPC